MDVQVASRTVVEAMINAGVRRAYTHPDNKLRASILSDPAGTRRNTGDNTPAVIHTRRRAWNTVDVRIAAKGGGSENKAKLAHAQSFRQYSRLGGEHAADYGGGLVPSWNARDWHWRYGRESHGVGQGIAYGSIDIHELRERGPTNRSEELRLEIMDGVNALGIGAQGLGGLTTVLDVKIKDYPTHAASLPVAMIPNCAATRHAHFTLSGEGPALQSAPDIDQWPDLSWEPGNAARRVDLDTVTAEDVRHWTPGETILLSGTMYTGRDAAHKRMTQMLQSGEPLPVDLTGKFIYYVGPVDPVGDEVVGPAGPTTATRMDKFTDYILEQTGLIGMIGKAERGPIAIEAIKRRGAVYLMAVGGAAYLVSKAIIAAKVVAFEDLGMEAIYAFTVKDMPVSVAVDSRGESVHISGPALWKRKIEEQAIELI